MLLPRKLLQGKKQRSRTHSSSFKVNSWTQALHSERSVVLVSQYVPFMLLRNARTPSEARTEWKWEVLKLPFHTRVLTVR
jgi:hypothetical protein